MKGIFLTIDEVAESLNITRQTLAKYIKNKELNALKINKSYRIAYQDFYDFIATHSVKNIPKISSLKKSKGCYLDYVDKSDEIETLLSKSDGMIKMVEKNHSLPENKFIFGDNYDVLRDLLEKYQNKIDLVYIDPPCGTGKNFNSIYDDKAYSDRLVNKNYLDFLRKRLILLRELLSTKGSIYVHVDKKIGHYVKIIMDEIFGYNNFINDITRIKCNPKNFSRNAYGNFSDMILFYAKKRDMNIWNDIKEPMDATKKSKLFPKKHPKFGYYSTNPIHAPGKTINGDTGKIWKGILPPNGRHWRYSRKVLDELDKKGLIEWSNNGNPRKIILAKNHVGLKIQDIWEFKDKGFSFVDYPTQKNYKLLEQIISNSSNEDSIVMDCFAGSGSTLNVSNKLNRKWIGVDNSPYALEVIKKVFIRDNVKCNYFEFVS